MKLLKYCLYMIEKWGRSYPLTTMSTGTILPPSLAMLHPMIQKKQCEN
jgi:hypothetical protein